VGTNGPRATEASRTAQRSVSISPIAYRLPLGAEARTNLRESYADRNQETRNECFLEEIVKEKMFEHLGGFYE